MNEKQRVYSKHVWTTIRVSIAVGLLAYILFRIREDFSSLDDVFLASLHNWPWWVASLVLIFLGLCAGVLRWHCILRAAGLPMPPAKVFSIFFIGQFFNAFMLGACGGDLARVLLVTREWPGKKAEAAATALIDRAVGLLILIIVGSGFILLRLRLFFDNVGNRWPAAVMMLFLVGSISLILLLLRKNLFEHWSFFRRLEEKTALGRILRKIYDGFFVFHRNPRALVLATLHSLSNMIFLTLACASLGVSIGLQIPLVDYFTVLPIITVLSSIPVTPGGFGVREGLFIELLNTLGVPPVQALPLSIMTYLGGLVWSLFGGLIFLGYSSSEGHTVKQEIRAIQDASDTPTAPD